MTNINLLEHRLPKYVGELKCQEAKGSRGDAPLLTADPQAGHGSNLHCTREKEATVYRGIDVRLPGQRAARATQVVTD